MVNKIKVLLADDHPVVLAGLSALIQTQSDYELVGQASSGNSALMLIREKMPDVAVLDVSMPILNGIVVAKKIKEEFPNVRILILSVYEDRTYLKQAFEAGVSGYVLKRSAAEDLIQAIKAVYIGGFYVDPAIASRVFEPRKEGRTLKGTTKLTEREAEVLKHAALGYTNKEIAHLLDVNIKTVETFKARGSMKAGLKTRADIVRYAACQGWLANA